MVISATLHINGHQNETNGIDLLTCEYSFSQDTDQRGLPTSKVNGGQINVSFKSFDDTEILQWMISRDDDKNGKIIFSGDQHSKSFKTLEFKDARLVYYNENFVDKTDMVVSLTISARELILSGVSYSNDWLGYEQA